jgi:flagellar protein FliO/FliZ
MDPARYILAVLFVTALLLGAIWLLRRMNLVGVNKSTGIRIIAAQNIGTRERLLVVRFGQEDVLLGVTAQSITRLGSAPAETSHSGSSLSGSTVNDASRSQAS